MAAIAFVAVALAAAAAPAAPKSILAGPVAIAAGAGSMWVVDSDGIVRVTPRFAMTRVVSVTRAASIVRGPDGAMWFTVFTPPRIGRIDASGAVTYFDVPRAPIDLAVGGDGNLWFTEDQVGSDDRGRIARMTPSGTVTEFGAGLRHQSAPEVITRGPGGDLWFTDLEGRVGHVTLAGAISEYAVPGAGYDDPADIAAGPDGALWFTMYGHIGRVTARGRIHLYPSPFEFPEDLAVGPDGKLWYTGSTGYADSVAGVEVMGVHGGAKRYRRGFSDELSAAITRGPGGRDMWVTETGRTGDHVVRVTRDGHATEYPPPPACRVPRVRRMPLLDVRDLLFRGLCRLDPRSAPAGRMPGSIALSVHPRPGTILPYGANVRVAFGPVPPLPRRCAVPFAGHRLARTRRTLVFAYKHWEEHEESTTTYGACVRPNGPLRTIAHGIDELTYYQAAATFAAAGPLVAYSFFDIDHYGNGDAAVRLVDLRAGTRRRVWQQRFEQGCGQTEVISLVLTRAGSTAWSDSRDDRGYDCGGTFVYEVWVADARGRPRLLDSGPGIDPHSLRRQGHTISWRDGAVTRAAPIS